MKQFPAVSNLKTDFLPRLWSAASGGSILALLLINGTAPAATATAKVYLTNGCSNAVTAYPVASNGNVAPLSPVTGLAKPLGIAVGSRGDIFVANYCSGSITVYPPGSNGDAYSTETILGPDTGLNSPAGLALDSKKTIYVTNRNNNSVTVYAPGSNGDAVPVATISGPNSGLQVPRRHRTGFEREDLCRK